MISLVPSLAGLRRVAVTGLAILPLLIVALVTGPAMLVLPFTPGGTDRVLKLIGKMIAWTRVILSAGHG